MSKLIDNDTFEKFRKAHVSYHQGVAEQAALKRENAKNTFDKRLGKAQTNIDDIIVPKCPNAECKAKFQGFDGCFAVTCSVCKHHFCGWCMADMKLIDAHPHVKTCSEKGRTQHSIYFGAEWEFKMLRAHEKLGELQTYLNDLLHNEHDDGHDLVKKVLKQFEVAFQERRICVTVENDSVKVSKNLN